MDAPKLVNATRRLFTIALALLLPLCLSPGAAWAQKAASETGTLAQGGSPAFASQDDAQDLPSKFACAASIPTATAWETAATSHP